MTWKEKMVARILLVVASMLAGDGELKDLVRGIAKSVYIAPAPPPVIMSSPSQPQPGTSFRDAI